MGFIKCTSLPGLQKRLTEAHSAPGFARRVPASLSRIFPLDIQRLETSKPVRGRKPTKNKDQTSGAGVSEE